MSEAVNGIGNGHQNQATKSVQNKEDALELLRTSVVKAVINHIRIKSFSKDPETRTQVLELGPRD